MVLQAFWSANKSCCVGMLLISAINFFYSFLPSVAVSLWNESVNQINFCTSVPFFNTALIVWESKNDPFALRYSTFLKKTDNMITKYDRHDNSAAIMLSSPFQSGYCHLLIMQLNSVTPIQWFDMALYSLYKCFPVMQRQKSRLVKVEELDFFELTLITAMDSYHEMVIFSGTFHP